MVDGLNTAAPKSVRTARPSTISYPAGVCIHELATMIQNADSVAPIATIHAETYSVRRETFPQPSSSTPTKLDSRKKAKIPSAARGAPKMSPTNREYSDQLVPNWNSRVSPVTTPRAKVTANSFSQNRAIRPHASSPVLW